MKIRALIGAAALSGAALVGTNADPAAAACNINVEVHNLDSTATVVDWHDSKVKIQGGLWDRLGPNGDTSVVAGGGTISRSVNTLFNCGANRRWQFNFEQGGSSQTVYFPSTTGWTTNQTVHVHANFP